MYKLKQTLLAGGAILLSASVFILTLPLVLFMTSALFLTGIAGALVLRYQMRKQASLRPQDNGIIIEGSCQSEPLR